MPSSKPLAVALAVLVLLSGCSMLSGGGSDATTTPAGPDHHELVFAADTGGTVYEATITVARDGETVLTETLESDGNGTYLDLGDLDAPDSYTVTVNTTVPAASGTRSDRFTLNASRGNATAIQISRLGIHHSVFRLPRERVDGRLGITAETDLAKGHVQVWYRGQRIAATNYSTSDQTGRIVDAVPANLSESGVYRVAVRVDGEWTNETLVVGTSNAVVVWYSVDGYLDSITVEPSSATEE